MIKETTCGKIEFALPKANRNLLDKHHTYTLILQNNFTKRVHILKVVDQVHPTPFTFSPNPVRFRFEAENPKVLKPENIPTTSAHSTTGTSSM
ncbi:MAG: hypothetical protein LUE93_13410 [Bacteroides sp.]|nr:hypothetical protein [Bacteroides sp.]